MLLASEKIGQILDKCLFLVVIEFISEEMGKRLDLAVSWLFEEYCMLQGFNQIGALIRGGGQLVAEERYNSTLCRLVKAYMDRADHPERDRYGSFPSHDVLQHIFYWCFPKF